MSISSTEALSVRGLHRISWRLWLAWVTVCALGPVLTSIAATAIGKQVLPSHPLQSLIFLMDALLAVCAILAIPVTKWLVLRRVMPALKSRLWFLAVLGATVLTVVLLVVEEKDVSSRGLELRQVARLQGINGGLTLHTILMLPWTQFLPWTIASSAATSFLPAWTLGRASGLRRATFVFLTASVAGTCVSTILDQVYQMTMDSWLRALPTWFWALNGLSWTERFEILSLRGGVGAVWGATTAIFVVLLAGRSENVKATRHRFFAPHGVGGIAVLLSMPLLLAILAPFAGYLGGRHGLIVGAPELRRALSFAPREDTSRGESVLTYAHDIDVLGVRVLESVIAPDSRTAIVRTIDNALLQVDLATGQELRKVADGFGPLDYPSKTWSPDGRYLAIRSYGAEVPTPNSHYTKYKIRVRLYSWPNAALVAEFPGRNECLQISYYGKELIFSNDGKMLWLVCNSSDVVTTDNPTRVMRLNVPSLEIVDVHPLGDFEIDGLESVGDGVWAWKSTSKHKSFRIYDLTAGKEVANLLKPKELIGTMAEQTDRTQLDAKTARLEFCGLPPGMPENSDRASGVCRTLTFDIATETLLGSADNVDSRFTKNLSGETAMLAEHGLRIDAFWREDSETGELVVSDSVTGRERQRITSVAQRPLRISADGRWLMTTLVHEGSLRLYRIQP